MPENIRLPHPRARGRAPAAAGPALEDVGRGGARRLPCDVGGHGDLRCGCGSLLAKVVPGGVELKCRRCKQTWEIPLQDG